MDVFDRVAEQLGPFDGDPVALDGGITNRNYRWGDYVVRVPGAGTEHLGIDRGNEAIAASLAARLGIAPAVALTEPLVTRFVEGRTLEKDELRARAAEVHALLHCLHGCGEQLPMRFDAIASAQAFAATARARGIEPPARYEAALARARGRATPYEPVPCHNDLLAANFLQGTDGRLYLIDWEYAGMGDARFDEANFAANVGLEGDADQCFLADFWEGMWGVCQSAVSDLDFDFTAYAEERFARLAL